MAICTNSLARQGYIEKPRQTEPVCLRFSNTLASQGMGTSHPKESLNLGLYFMHPACITERKLSTIQRSAGKYVTGSNKEAKILLVRK